MYTARPISLSTLLLIPSIGTSILNSLPVSAYIPAQPVNDTSSLNLTDSSTIGISWVDPGYPAGVFAGPVSYQLEADVRTGGMTQGALVHFTESSAGENLTTSTPWIAYISCDLNETTASEEWDIFTLARDRGAVSALLYTTTSESCLINQEYIQEFEKPLDVFATKSKQTARVIESQFGNTNSTFYTYNGALLNSSGAAVNASIAGATLTTTTYLAGTLTARNSTGQATATGSIPNTTSSDSANSGIPAGMIALYVIVGVVSGIITLIFLCGLRRFFAHPERYGRREADDSQGGQTRAGGVAQAILDTFPVIKFRRTDDQNMEQGFHGTQGKRLSSHGDLTMVAMPVLDHTLSRGGTLTKRSSSMANTDSYHSSVTRGNTLSPEREEDEDSVKGVHQPVRRSVVSHSSVPGTQASGSSSIRSSGFSPTPETAEGEITDEHCPICLLEFETGDDLRILPCEREHVYHQACIDPWLLNVSSSCPLCRKDFNNPKPSPNSSVDPPISPTTSQPPTTSGFAKYLAFMRRERGTGTARTGVGTGGSRRNDEEPRRRREADQTGPGGY